MIFVNFKEMKQVKIFWRNGNIWKDPVPSCDLSLPFSLSCIKYIRICSRTNTLISANIVRPRWTVEPTDKQFAQGSDAKIDCKADGFPQPKISWKKAIGKSTLVYYGENMS